MIKFTSLSKSFGAQLLLDDCTFNINSKDRIGLVGRNGHGKTTLFRLILGKDECDEGQIVIPKNYTIGHLEQHLTFTEATVLDEACLGLPEHAIHDTWRAEKILSGLGFKDSDFHRHPLEFSGGFQVRLNLAKVLVRDPDLLLLDEPTNYLDIISIRWLAQFLKQWPNELLLITHDRQFMDSVTTHTMGIHRSKIRKISGSTNKYFGQLIQEEEIYEKTRRNDEKKRKDTELFISRFRAKARLAGMVQSRIKSLEKTQKLEQLSKIEDLEFSFPGINFPSKIMLELKDLAFGYDDKLKPLLENLNLTINKQDRIAIIGKNGKGKTTLLNLINEQLKPTSGQIKKHNALKIGYFGQTNIDRLSKELTVEEELILTDPEHSRQRARDVAGIMMFSGDDATKRISVLSGGERSRVLLGKLLLSYNHLLLLDEPTNHLDLESCEALLEAIRHFEGSVAIVTHDEMFLHQIATKFVVFNYDQVFVFNGTYQHFLNEIGWDNPAAADQLSNINKRLSLEDVSTIKENEPKATGQAKKISRQERAKLIQEKSKALKPMQTKLEQLEKSIELLENEQSSNNQAMIEASINNQAEELITLPKRNKEIASHLEEMYDYLSRLSEELDQASNTFDKKINAFESD